MISSTWQLVVNVEREGLYRKTAKFSRVDTILQDLSFYALICDVNETGRAIKIRFLGVNTMQIFYGSLHQIVTSKRKQFSCRNLYFRFYVTKRSNCLINHKLRCLHNDQSWFKMISMMVTHDVYWSIRVIFCGLWQWPVICDAKWLIMIHNDPPLWSIVMS